MYTMFKRPNNQNAKNETDLLSLVGDYDKFKGWDEVHQRVLSHANEVSIKSPAGWYPLEHAFYHHPDYPRKPMPLAVVQSFIAADPKSAKWSVVEACSNPFTLNESLEVLLHAVDAQYFDLQAERDFHRICKNDNPSTVDEKARCTFAMNTEMKTTYVQIAAKKGLRWDRGLKSMLKDIEVPSASIYFLILSAVTQPKNTNVISLTIQQHWHFVSVLLVLVVLSSFVA